MTEKGKIWCISCISIRLPILLIMVIETGISSEQLQQNRAKIAEFHKKHVDHCKDGPAIPNSISTSISRVISSSKATKSTSNSSTASVQLGSGMNSTGGKAISPTSAKGGLNSPESGSKLNERITTFHSKVTLITNHIFNFLNSRVEVSTLK